VGGGTHGHRGTGSNFVRILLYRKREIQGDVGKERKNVEECAVKRWLKRV
jgi:hypothetical protein